MPASPNWRRSKPPMPYQVTFERQARKYLAGLRDLKLLRRLREAPPELATDPRAPGFVKLQGEDELYRVRIGITASSIRFKTPCSWCKSGIAGKFTGRRCRAVAEFLRSLTSLSERLALAVGFRRLHRPALRCDCLRHNCSFLLSD